MRLTGATILCGFILPIPMPLRGVMLNDYVILCIAAALGGAVNAIAGGPNQTQPIDKAGFKGQVTRGSGRDVRADGKVKEIPLPVGASGTLEPPTGRAEITLSGVKGRGVGLPGRIRIYTTPSGELDFDLPGPIKVGPISIRPKGTYVIGTPDPPGRKR